MVEHISTLIWQSNFAGKYVYKGHDRVIFNIIYKKNHKIYMKLRTFKLHDGFLHLRQCREFIVSH